MKKERGIESYILSRKKRVPLADVRPDSKNVRDRYSRGGLVILAHSIARNGQLQPALMESYGGKFYLIAGHRRYWSSRFAKESGWMDRDWMLGKVVSKLPEVLRLRLQCAENEYKEPAPKDNLANVFWERYKLSLLDQLGEVGDPEKELVRSAENFSQIPRSLSRYLPISTYAKDMGFKKEAVRQAFSYQKLHQDIQRRVADPNNPLSYSAACALAKIEGKSEQRRVLKNIKDQDKLPTKFHVRAAVKQYLKSIETENETGSFMVAEGPGVVRGEILSELSFYLGKSERLVRVLESVDSLVGNIKGLGLKVEGHGTSPEKIVTKFKTVLEKNHNRLLKEDHYRNCWDFVPKRASLAEFILENARGGVGGRIRSAMDLVESKVIPINKIDPNPLNPRGKRRSFDQKSLEKLAASIARDGLVHDILVMKKGSKYVNLEGHRRHAAMQLLFQEGRASEIGALVVPKLSEEQQVKLMCDSDLFEQISLDAKSRSIARQYRLERKEAVRSFKLNDFIKVHPEWSSRVIKESVAYDSLPEQVKRLQTQGIITYGAAIEISRIKDSQVRRDFAVSAAILGQSKSELKKAVRGSKEDMLFDKGEMEEQRRQGELRILANELNNNLEGVQQRMKQVMESERLFFKFIKDDYLFHRFQYLMKTLQSLN